MDTNDSEEPEVKKRKTTTHDSTIFKTDASSDGNNKQSIGMDAFSYDIAVHFASYLSSRDLVSLALTCRRFGGSNKNVKSLPFSLSLVGDTARQIICNAKQDERDNLPANRTYIEKYNELEKLRGPRIFDQLIGKNISYVDNDKSLIKCTVDQSQYSQTAICNHVMRAGRHYATFTVGTHSCMIGIIRPLPYWNKKGFESFNPHTDQHRYSELLSERTERWGNSNVHYCSLFGFGRKCWGGWVRRYESDHWDERDEASFEKGEILGMLLDLDAGTLSIYKNGQRVCVMKDGLSGEYCWTTTIWSYDESVRIEKGSIPTD